MTNEFALIRHITKMSWRLLIIVATLALTFCNVWIRF